jgi:LPXTG-site transpeptidase (sortase) family protein
MAILSDLLFTAAFLILLYILWQLYWTAVPAYYDQKELVSRSEWDMPEDVTKAAQPLDYMPCDKINGKASYERVWGVDWQKEYDLNWKEPTEIKSMIGRVYVPKFGADFVHNLVQGTDKEIVLDRQGFGHYESTVMPGCVGNFAAAAHRDGYGAPLGDVEKIKVGDSLIVRTRHYWYVYSTTGYKIVQPEQGDVLLPVPGDSTAKPTKRLLTYTTCHPRWSMDQRYILQGEFKYWAEVKSGVPQELLDVGLKLEN